MLLNYIFLLKNPPPLFSVRHFQFSRKASLVAMSTSALLSPREVLNVALGLVPESNRTLSTPISALTLLIHSIHSQLSFHLVSGSSGDITEDWTTTNELNYKHDQSSLNFKIKLIELGGRGIVLALAVEVSCHVRSSRCRSH